MTLLSHAKASVEQIGLVGCRDSTHISLNKSAVLQPCVCVCGCVRLCESECVCLSKQPGTHLVRKALRGFVCAYVSGSLCEWVCVCVCE